MSTTKHPGVMKKPKAASNRKVNTTTNTIHTETKEITPVTTTPKTAPLIPTMHPTEVVAGALAVVRQREQEMADAVAAEAALDLRLDRGDEGVSGSMMTSAGNETLRATRLLDAARKTLALAKTAEAKATAMGSPDVAEMVAALVAGNAIHLGLFGIPVSVVDNPPTEAPEQVPCIVTWQDKPTKRDALSSVFSGECQIGFITGEGHALDTTGKIRNGIVALSREGGGTIRMFNNTPVTTLGGGVQMKALTAVVAGATPELPDYVASLPASILDLFADSIGKAVKWGAGTNTERGIVIGNGGADQLISDVLVRSATAKIVSTKQDSDDKVRRAVEVRIVAHCESRRGNDLGAMLDRIMSRQVGAFVGPVGRITDVTAAPGGPAEAGGREAVALYTFTSQAV